MAKIGLTILAAAALSAAPTAANVVFFGHGALSGSSAGANTDLSGLSAPLENGIAGNFLGGIGSGLAYAGGTTFIATPDRGPNATPYNPVVDDTVSYISRFQTLDLTLTLNPAGSPLPFSVGTRLTKTTLLSSPALLNYGAGQGTKIDGVTPIGSGAPATNTASTYYFSGRSDNFGGGTSGDPANGRFDPESVRVSNDGKSVFISDEYGPYVREFDRATGRLVKTFKLPDNLDVVTLSSSGETEIAGNASGRVANKGMEGLALTPDGKTLVGIMQAPLIQDAADPATAKLVRIVTIDIADGKTHEYGVNLTTGSGISDIVAVNDHEFLIDERDGKGLGDGSKAKIKQIFKIDIADAVDITNLTGAAASAAAVPKSASPFIDLVASLTGAGFTTDQIPAKIEGLSFGQDQIYDGALYHTLYIANDNDFVPSIAGPNQFFVFGFQDRDLPGLVPQAFGTVPEPSTWAMLLTGFATAGALLRRRRRLVVIGA